MTGNRTASKIFARAINVLTVENDHLRKEIRAGGAVRPFPSRHSAVLCLPGDNDGDAARCLVAGPRNLL